jgi:methionyl-tRNA formyltransferase
MSSDRVLFMGSPEIAVPTLEALLQAGENIVGVVSQPDRPVGRHQVLTPPAVAAFAKEKNLPLFQPEKVKNNPEFLETIKNLKPDVVIVVAYGRLLPKDFLDLPPRGCINVHFSLLPKYRGAAPMQRALMNAETETGVTTFRIVEKLDAGPILMQKKVEIHEEDTTEILGRRLTVIGTQLVKETLASLRSGALKPIPQNDREATLAPPLTKEDGLVKWNEKARYVCGQIRGVTPWPGAYTFWENKRLKIHRAEILEGKRSAEPGTVTEIIEEGIEVACTNGALLLTELQLEGGRRLSAKDFLKGHAIAVGEKL